MNKLNFKEDKFIRWREDGAVYRLYFESGCHTLSKRKCGSTIDNIVEKCKRYNARFRNDFKIFGDYVEVYCYVIKTGEIQTVYFDVEDWLKFHDLYVSVQISDYAEIFMDSKRWRIHRFIMGLDKEIDTSIENCLVDHLDGNGYNNRKENLRVTSLVTNSRNTGFFTKNTESGVKGVNLNSTKTKWRVRFDSTHKATLFEKLSDAVDYRYRKGVELGFYFREGSTTIESFIAKLRAEGK